jgi:hypothetical protein
MKNDFENQLDKIRVELYERTKTMTNSETVCATNENARKIAESYGIKITKGVSVSVKTNAHAL